MLLYKSLKIVIFYDCVTNKALIFLQSEDHGI